MMYTYDFFWYSGARNADVYGAGDDLLLDVYDDASTAENDVYFRFRNVIANGYDSSSIVNVFFDTGSLGTTLFTDLSIWDQSVGGGLAEPGDLDPSNTFLQFDKIAFSADFSAGRPSGSLTKTLGVNPGEYLTVKGVLGGGWQFADVIALLNVGMNDTYNDALYWDALSPDAKNTYRSGADDGLRISLLMHSLVPNTVNPDGHGLYVIDGFANPDPNPDPSGDNDTLVGTSGKDTLDGGVGADTMSGLAGSDTYFVDNPGDVVIEVAGQGTDTVKASIAWTLGENVENLVLLGSAIGGTGNGLNNALTGNSGDNTLTGLAGNDTLDGRGGADTLIGGTGNDSYVVDTTVDKIMEKPGEGTDTVKSSATYTLAPGSNLENLTLTGSGAIDGFGNELKNVLTGNSGSNRLDGGAGNDVLVGGKGQDFLTGGEGADRFDFNALADSVPGAVDVVTDFLTGTDKIDLSTLDANTLPTATGNQMFEFIDADEFSAAGQARFDDGILQVNVDGAFGADLELALTGVISLAETDLIL